MEKGRTYFEQDVAFMAEMQFDTVKIDQCGSGAHMRTRTGRERARNSVDP